MPYYGHWPQLLLLVSCRACNSGGCRTLGAKSNICVWPDEHRHGQKRRHHAGSNITMRLMSGSQQGDTDGPHLDANRVIIVTGLC
jgi:hypothetical protein